MSVLINMSDNDYKQTGRQAIVTKYLGPTDHRGARVKATAQVGSVTIEWDHSLNGELNHAVAAKTLADKHGWLNLPDNPLSRMRKRLYGGAMPNDGYCFVIVETE